MHYNSVYILHLKILYSALQIKKKKSSRHNNEVAGAHFGMTWKWTGSNVKIKQHN